MTLTRGYIKFIYFLIIFQALFLQGKRPNSSIAMQQQSSFFMLAVLLSCVLSTVLATPIPAQATAGAHSAAAEEAADDAAATAAAEEAEDDAAATEATHNASSGGEDLSETEAPEAEAEAEAEEDDDSKSGTAAPKGSNAPEAKSGKEIFKIEISNNLNSGFLEFKIV